MEIITLNFNHILICGTCLFSLLPIISHVITLLVISSLTRINNNCWKVCFLIWRKELLSKWKGKTWMCCVWWLFLCNCLFSNSGSDLNFACQCLMLDFYQRKGHIIFHVCLVRDLFKWKHKLGSNSLTFGGRVLSWKLCVLCSSVKREKKNGCLFLSTLESASNVTNIMSSDHLWDSKLLFLNLCWIK